MYKCQKCNKTTESGESQNKVVTRKRERTYVNIEYDKFGKEVEKISNGWEIAEETHLCKECYKPFYSAQEVKEIKKNDDRLYKREILSGWAKPEGQSFPNPNIKQVPIAERKYPNSNYQGKNFDPDYYKKKYANQEKSK